MEVAVIFRYFGNNDTGKVLNMPEEISNSSNNKKNFHFRRKTDDILGDN